MALLIDGYNLLHVTGIFGKGRGPGFLERSRNALLNFLTIAISDAELRQTTIVFDAKDAPFGLQRTVEYGPLTVRYAPRDQEADDLIEELIRADHSPKQLTVVSSDRRIQRAARRRKATAMDSDQWYAALVRQHRQRTQNVEVVESKPHTPLTEDEVEAWVDEFDDVAKDIAAEATAAAIDSSPTDDVASPPRDEKNSPDYQDIANPFPPGYAEDLEDDDEI